MKSKKESEFIESKTGEKVVIHSEKMNPLKQMIGKKIICIRPITDDERKASGSENGIPQSAIELDDGTGGILIIPCIFNIDENY